MQMRIKIKPGVAILISDKIDLKIKKSTRDKEGHYIMIKGSVQEEDIAIVNIYAPNIGAPQYVSIFSVESPPALHPKLTSAYDTVPL